VQDDAITLRDIALEQGDTIDAVRVRYRLEGTINAARDNVVLVVHALTGTTRASDWWKGVIGEGAAIDPTKHAILCPNLLGGCDGTTGPSNANPDALPPFGTRDQATVLAALLDALGIDAPLLVCGGSLGGMVTLEFAASFPQRVRGAVALAAPAAQTAQGLAWNAIMRRAIALGGAGEGLALARMVGMLSYRTPEGLERRFGRTKGDAGGFRVNEWLDIHGEKLVARFDATSYGALIDAMDTHDVRRARGMRSRRRRVARSVWTAEYHRCVRRARATRARARRVARAAIVDARRGWRSRPRLRADHRSGGAAGRRCGRARGGHRRDDDCGRVGGNGAAPRHSRRHGQQGAAGRARRGPGGPRHGAWHPH
jgi:homoserine O-acetyltransferase